MVFSKSSGRLSQSCQVLPAATAPRAATVRISALGVMMYDLCWLTNLCLLACKFMSVDPPVCCFVLFRFADFCHLWLCIVLFSLLFFKCSFVRFLSFFFSFLSLPCFLDSLLLAQCSQIQRVNRIRFFGDFIASMGAAVPTSASWWAAENQFQVEDLWMVDDFSLKLEEGHHPQHIFLWIPPLRP